MYVAVSTTFGRCRLVRFFPCSPAAAHCKHSHARVLAGERLLDQHSQQHGLGLSSNSLTEGLVDASENGASVSDADAHRQENVSDLLSGIHAYFAGRREGHSSSDDGAKEDIKTVAGEHESTTSNTDRAVCTPSRHIWQQMRNRIDNPNSKWSELELQPFATQPNH